MFSVDDSTDLTITDITIDDTDGSELTSYLPPFAFAENLTTLDTDALGTNTDGFDIGSSTGITITGANVYNQDDCVAINSGTVSISSYQMLHLHRKAPA